MLRLADGFESGSLGAFWLPGNYGTGLYAPGAVVVSKDYARSGIRSARITVKEGDVEQRGDDGRSVERAELDSGHPSPPGPRHVVRVLLLAPRRLPRRR